MTSKKKIINVIDAYKIYMDKASFIKKQCKGDLKLETKRLRLLRKILKEYSSN